MSIDKRQLLDAVQFANDFRQELDIGVRLGLGESEDTTLVSIVECSDNPNRLVDVDCRRGSVRLTSEVDRMYPEIVYGLRKAGIDVRFVG